MRAVVFMFLLAVYPMCAKAYIDPGSGSLLFQALAASVLGIGVFWRRVVAFVRSLCGCGKKNPVDDGSKK
ncbi:MAG: hypothetical protein LBD15_04005 [Holosporales bacterium]|jgi:hypothetical protein|nr:hypothetical protein [Holosporales bacterium]